MSKQYYYLISGLTDLKYDETTLPITLLELKEELSEQLSEEDKKLMQLIFISYDNRNIIDELAGKKLPKLNLGDFSVEEIAKACKVPEEGDLLEFQQDFIHKYKTDTPIHPHCPWETQLSWLYYDYLLSQTNNAFLRDWFEYEMNLKNLFVALTCRANGLEVKQQVIGSNYFSEKLRESSSKDFGLSGEYDFVEKVIYEFENISLNEKEKLIEKFRWEQLEELSPFAPFSIDVILSYILKLTIIERWSKLLPETGKEKFNQEINSLKQSFEFSNQFA